MKLTLGEECLILRRRAKLHLLDIAKKVKLSHTYLSRIELDDERAKHEKALKYRDFLMSRQGDSADKR